MSAAGVPTGCVADVRIVSITPSVTQVKVGDVVSFTAVAANYGPDAVEVWLNISGTTITCAWNTTAEGCVEGGVLRPGQTRTITGTEIVAPATGSLSNTACAWSPELTSPEDCKTATVTVDPQPCPLSIPGATQTLGGVTYKLEGEDTFTKDAPLGSFAQPQTLPGSSTAIAGADSLPVVYTGDHGMGWTEYPDGWPSTNTQPPYAPTTHEGYQPSTVQSVHDGMLDFYLHDDSNGYPVGASISPAPVPIDPGSRYQTYGAWSFCERVVPGDSQDLADFHQAPLLWPDDQNNNSLWQSAESDFPEADLNASATTPAPYQFSAFAHYGGSGAKDQFQIPAVDPSFDQDQWHVYTQIWGPGFRSYYVDGLLVGTSTNQVYSAPERWQLQIEPSQTGGSGSGHVYVKWAWIGTLGP